MFDFLDQFTSQQFAESGGEVIPTDGGSGDGSTATPPGTGGATTTQPTLTPPAGTGQQPTVTIPPARTFSQRDLDQIVTDRVDRANRAAEQRYQQELQRVNAEYERMMQQIQQQGQRPEAEGYRQPVNPLETRIEAQERILNELQLDRVVNYMGQRYPDFAQNEEAILRTAIDLKTTNLDVAYRYWKHDELVKARATPAVDEEAVGKRAVEKYLADKRATSEGTPAPEGRGGSTPTSAPKKIKTMDDADKATAEALRRMDRS